jgi:hypothetical protein
MSIVTTGFALGISMGTLFAGILAVYSLVLPFVVIGAMGVAAAVMVHRMVPETIGKSGEENLAR